jgi:septal ring factor EnvC (AmiA/AmiB activator)
LIFFEDLLLSQLMKAIRFFLSLFTTFLLSFSIAQAQTSAELQRQRERLDREIKQLSESLKNTSSDKTLTLRQVNALTAQLRLRSQKIETINREIRLINGQIQENTKSIKELEGQLAQLRKDYEQMVLFAYRNRNAYNKMMFIFASRDFNQAFKRVKYLQQLNESRKVKAGEIAETQKQIQEKLEALQASREEQAMLLKEQQAERAEIAKEQGEESRVLKALTQQETQFKQEISKRQQELKRLTAAIDLAIKRELEEQRRIEEEARKAALKAEAERTGKTVEEVTAAATVTTPAKKTDAELLAATPEAAKLSADFADNKGKLPWPVKNGIVTLGYGKHTAGINVNQDVEGIRIQTHQDMPVTAVFDGEVSVVIPMQGLGYVVLVKHGKYFTLYGNMRSLRVKKGDKVKVGQQLGTAITDSEGLTEVYFEVIETTTRMNPELWLAK